MCFRAALVGFCQSQSIISGYFPGIRLEDIESRNWLQPTYVAKRHTSSISLYYSKLLILMVYFRQFHVVIVLFSIKFSAQEEKEKEESWSEAYLVPIPNFRAGRSNFIFPPCCHIILESHRKISKNSKDPKPTRTIPKMGLL